MKTSVGITTYIHNSLMKGSRFSPPGQRGCTSRKQRGKSMSIGRQADRAFQHIFQRSRTDNLMGVAVARARMMHTMLSSVGIRVCSVQVPVTHEPLGIHTRLDALGVNRFGEIVVIELKTSQKSISMHKSSRHSLCKNLSLLSNGVQNSEHHHHMLQTGFGMLALRKSYPDIACKQIRGIVITACSDSAYSISVPLLFAACSLYESPHITKPRRCIASTKCKVIRGRAPCQTMWDRATEEHIANMYKLVAVHRHGRYFCIFKSNTSQLCCSLLNIPWHKLSAAKRSQVTVSFPKCGAMPCAVISPSREHTYEIISIQRMSA